MILVYVWIMIILFFLIILVLFYQNYQFLNLYYFLKNEKKSILILKDERDIFILTPKLSILNLYHFLKSQKIRKEINFNPKSRA